MSDERKEDLSLSEEPQVQPLRIDEASDDSAGAVRAAVDPARARDDESDDDETWTNQPASAKEAIQAPESEQDEQDDHDEEEEEAERARASRRAIKSGRDVVCDELPERAQRAASRLKPFLTGVLVIELTNSGERFVFDWRDDPPKTLPITRDVKVTLDSTGVVSVTSDSVQADAMISLSEDHIMSIRSGDLNPQIGMLTEKIRVKGRVGPAVYIFNLIAPRSRN